MKKEKSKYDMSSGGMARFIWILGVVGAAVYYISNATSFGMGVIGFLKAMVWPAFLVHGLLGFLGM